MLNFFFSSFLLFNSSFHFLHLLTPSSLSPLPPPSPRSALFLAKNGRHFPEFVAATRLMIPSFRSKWAPLATGQLLSSPGGAPRGDVPPGNAPRSARHVQDLTNTAWAISSFGNLAEHGDVLRELWEMLMTAAADRDLRAEEKMQLFHIRTFAAASGIDLVFPVAAVALTVEAAARTSSLSPSFTQRSVASSLRRLRLGPVSEEVRCSALAERREEGGREGGREGERTGNFMAIDMAIEERELAVEFQGPSHYLTSWDFELEGRAAGRAAGAEPKAAGARAGARTRNPGKPPDDLEAARGGLRLTLIPSGTSLKKTALLEKMGWNVATVPFYEWHLLATGEEKEAYLRRKVGGKGGREEGEEGGRKRTESGG